MTQAGSRRYCGKSSDERDADRRGQLLFSAKELIGTHGYASTTVERICNRAHVSTRTFYEHFSNKEAILLAVYCDIASESFERAAASLVETKGRPIDEVVARAFLAYVAPMIEDLHAARVAFVEIVGASEQVEASRLAFRESLIDLVVAEGRAGVGRGELTGRDFRFAALALTGAADAIVHDWTLQSHRRPAFELESDLTDLALRLLTR